VTATSAPPPSIKAFLDHYRIGSPPRPLTRPERSCAEALLIGFLLDDAASCEPSAMAACIEALQLIQDHINGGADVELLTAVDTLSVSLADLAMLLRRRGRAMEIMREHVMMLSDQHRRRDS
jgi:hypothetical protein